MRHVFTLIEVHLLLLPLLIAFGLLSPHCILVHAFPTATTSLPSLNATATGFASSVDNDTILPPVIISDTTAELTEEPATTSVAEEKAQTVSLPSLSDNSDDTTEGYIVIEEQVVEEDDDNYNDDGSDSSTVSSAVVRTTEPMPSPKSSREQEEVLRELKKLWDITAGLGDSGNDSQLKSSLSEIVHLAYARVYSEPNETLSKLKYLLQKLQARLLGTEPKGDESFSTTLLPYETSTEPNFSTATTTLPSSLLTETAISSTYAPDGSRRANRRRRRRSYDDDRYGDVEAIFFANVNSEENSVLPGEKSHHQNSNLGQSSDQNNIHKDEDDEILEKYGISAESMTALLKNESDENARDLLERKLLQVGTRSPLSTTVLSVSSSTSTEITMTTPSSLVQKVVHIHDRRKPMPSFYLTPERIQELKNRVKTTSTLSPISIPIKDELENEVNSLQQQTQVDNYDVHISDNFPLLTTETPSAEKPSNSNPSTSDVAYSADEIALALFQLLRPSPNYGSGNDIQNNKGAMVTKPPQSGPSPSTILYQVGSLSSVLNFTLSRPVVNVTAMPTPSTTPSTSTTTDATTTTSTTSMSTTKSPSTLSPSVLSVLKLKDILRKNITLLDIPYELSNLGQETATRVVTDVTSTSTERQSTYQSDLSLYDYDDGIDERPPNPTPTFLDGARDTIAQMIDALTRLSVGAKLVLLFSICISILSIGFGLYATGPPLAGVGVLGIIIPIALLLLFETNTVSATGKRKLMTRQRQEHLIKKIQSEEFSKILDTLFDAVIKYGKG